MVELIVFCVFGFALLLTHAVYAIYYKIKTHSKKSVWDLMNKF